MYVCAERTVIMGVMWGRVFDNALGSSVFSRIFIVMCCKI